MQVRVITGDQCTGKTTRLVDALALFLGLSENQLIAAQEEIRAMIEIELIPS